MQTLYLLQKHGAKAAGERYNYYTDTGINVLNSDEILTSKWWDRKIIGLVWCGDKDSPLLVKATHIENTFYFGWY
jgi:hypothetical protein